MDDQLYFRQLLSGVDFAVRDDMATQMVNFVYLIGDRVTRECVIVDPAYAVKELIDIAESDAMTITGVLATHYHPDHVGGSMMGTPIEGISDLLQRINVPIHVQRTEVPWVIRTTGVTIDHLALHDSGDMVQVGSIQIAMVHTPGHTPGSQCFYVGDYLVAGDTLFLDGCGRTDLPGSDPEQMYDSLQTLASMPSSTIVYPGHRYSEPTSASLGIVKSTNYVFKPPTKQAWLQWFAR
ncbi:MAG: MBL fold metallo-hydrolase [Ilumatobacteraceae bacterium]